MAKVTGIALSACMLAGILLFESQAQNFGNPSRTDLGVGAAAIAMANNYVAAADDISALFWNPAAIAAYGKRHQVQFSLGGLRPLSAAEFGLDNSGFDTPRQMTSINIGNAGFLSSRGDCCRHRAFGFGLAYQTPYSLDMLLDYEGSFQSVSGPVPFRNRYLSTGKLDFWTGGFGLQLADQVFAGAALSLISGTGSEELLYQETQSVDSLDRSYHFVADRYYAGYDARIGLLTRATDLVNIGLRMEFPSVISFTENGVQTEARNGSTEYCLDGYMKTYYAGAVGVQVHVPLIRVVAEVDARAPYPVVRLSDRDQQLWRMGAGLGGELEVLPGVFKARAGYAWHQYNPNPYLVIYEDPTIEDQAQAPEATEGDHLATIGFALSLGSSIAIEGAYAHRLWMATTGVKLKELQQEQRGVVSMSFNF